VFLRRCIENSRYKPQNPKLVLIVLSVPGYLATRKNKRP